MDKTSNLKRYFQFFLVILAAGSIYPLIYLRTGYQQTILDVFQIQQNDLSTIYFYLGIVFVAGYFPSGWLADVFSAKKLLTVSLFMTGVAGLWFAQVPSYGGVIAIFVIWGIFSVFTFWSSHLKVVKLLSTKEDEGRFFGILDGGRGLVEAALSSIALIIFSRIIGKNTSPDVALQKSALVSVIYMYSICMIVVSILVGLFVNPDSIADKSNKEDSKQAVKKEKLTMASILSILKNKFVLTQGGVIFTGYIVTWAIYYFGGFMQSNIGVSAVDVAVLGVAMQWMRPIGGVLGGFFADKVGKSQVLLVALAVSSTAILAISMLPSVTTTSIFYGLIIVSALFIYVIRGTYWSLIGEINLPNSILGVAIGIISLIGYVPDIILPIVSNSIFKQYGNTSGNNVYFTMTAIAGFIGVLFVLLFKAFLKKENLVTKENLIQEDNLAKSAN